MDLRRAIIKKIDELLLKGEQVSANQTHYSRGFSIGEIEAFRALPSGVAVLVLGSEMPLDTQSATAIYNYLEDYYNGRLEEKERRKKDAVLKYLEVS